MLLSRHLIGIDKDDLGQPQREQHVEKEDLVAPDDALLLFLAAQPRRPAVGDKLDLEIVLLRGRERNTQRKIKTL